MTDPFTDSIQLLSDTYLGTVEAECVRLVAEHGLPAMSRVSVAYPIDPIMAEDRICVGNVVKSTIQIIRDGVKLSVKVTRSEP